MEIQAECKFDLPAVTALTRLQWAGRIDPRKVLAIHLCISIGVVLFSGYFMLTDPQPSGITLFIAALALAPLDCVFYFLLPRGQFKALGKQQNGENTYIFGENSIKITSQSQGSTGSSEMEYSVFVKICETSRYFFLFLNKGQAFIVDKTTVRGGTAREIRKRLTARANCKYVICRY